MDCRVQGRFKCVAELLGSAVCGEPGVGLDCSLGFGCVPAVCCLFLCMCWIEQEKGIRWMPWHQEAMKDVARCENPGGAASKL